MKRYAIRFLSLYFLLHALLFLCACSTTWVTEAEAIIGALTPAVEGILVILAGLGAAIPAGALTSIQTWGNQAQADLQNVVLPLIQQYNTAEAGAQPGILTEIKTVLSTISANLTSVLGALKITDPATQAKVSAVIDEFSDELTALLNLVPVLQTSVTDHDEIKALYAKLKSAKQFKKDFNKAAGAFGSAYAHWIK